MKGAKTQWTVGEVYKSPSSTLIEIKPSGSFSPSEWWPKIGDVLIVKPKETK